MNLTSQTIRLRERQTRLCRLRPADVDFLLAHHRQHLEVEFTPERHWYRLTPRGIAGVIAAPNCRLWIRPKLPWDNFARLLDPAKQWIVRAPAAINDSPLSLPDFLLERFVYLLRERITGGLHKGYVEQFEELAQIRGGIDLAAQMRSGPGLPQRFACHFDELSVGVPCNRLVKSIAERLLVSPWLIQHGRSSLEPLLSQFAEIESLPLTAEAFAQVLGDPRVADYRPLLELGQILVTASSSSCSKIGATFLLDMERLFERYVTLGLQRLLVDLDASIVAQPRLMWHEQNAGQPELSLRPDLVIRKKGDCSVVDVKWKEFTGRPEREDLHQILAYAAAASARRAILVYPGLRHQTHLYRMCDGRTGIHFTTLCMTGRNAQCERSLRQLARRVAST
jgi:5-methylcytosine-specific restriction enzyme subunit McrC